MKIRCTRGCICGCFIIDNTELSEATEETRKLALEKIKAYVLDHGISEDYILSGLLSQLYDNEAFQSKYELKEDEATYELLANGKESKDLLKSGEWKDIINDIPDVDPVFWWFMEDYIGLDYQYTCEECFDSVYSKTINI